MTDEPKIEAEGSKLESKLVVSSNSIHRLARVNHYGFYTSSDMRDYVNITGGPLELEGHGSAYFSPRFIYGNDQKKISVVEIIFSIVEKAQEKAIEQGATHFNVVLTAEEFDQKRKPNSIEEVFQQHATLINLAKEEPALFGRREWEEPYGITLPKYVVALHPTANFFVAKRHSL